MSESDTKKASGDGVLSDLRVLSSTRCFGGEVRKYAHDAASTKCEMKFNVYLPPAALRKDASGGAVPAVVYLAGLTCTEDNFMQKAGAQRIAAELGLALVCPDTSPRGCNIDGEDESWDFGTGAGFYVNATRAPFAANYHMYDYVAIELPALLQQHLPQIDTQRLSLCGHSMGGHGALVIGLREPGTFKTISAFAPICEPTKCAWGEKAFSGYLGSDDKKAWEAYDACALLRQYDGDCVDILVDQGTDDNFLKDGQLRTDALREAAAARNNASVVVQMRAGYDHSYYFIATFIESHLRFHAERLVDAQSQQLNAATFQSEVAAAAADAADAGDAKK